MATPIRPQTEQERADRRALGYELAGYPGVPVPRRRRRLRSPLTILRERRAYKADPFWHDLATELDQTTVMPTIYDHETEPDITRIEDGSTWLADLYTARLGAGDNEDTDPAWFTIGEPTVQLKVQRKYDGPTCNDCGTPSLVTPCVACSTRGNA